jgi:hypothetical protein
MESGRDHPGTPCAHIAGYACVGVQSSAPKLSYCSQTQESTEGAVHQSRTEIQDAERAISKPAGRSVRVIGQSDVDHESVIVLADVDGAAENSGSLADAYEPTRSSESEIVDLLFVYGIGHVD